MKEAHHQALQTLTANMHKAYWDKTKSRIGGGEFSPQEMGVALQALMDLRDENLKLIGALQRLYANYKALADSGDAGNWRLEDTQVGQDTLRLLQEVSE